MDIKCVASCRSSDGTPDFYPCVIQCTQEEYDDGDHYDKAREMALEDDYEQVGMVYDENDGPEFLFDHYFPRSGSINPLE